MNPDNGRSTRWARCPATTRTCSPTVPRSSLQRELRTPTAVTRCSTAPPERRPHRLDVQADHLHRGARERGVDDDSIFDDSGQFCVAGADAATTPATPSTAPLDLVNALNVSSDDFFYNLGALNELASAQRRAAAALGAHVRDRPPDRHRPARRGDGHAARRRRGATAATSSRPSATRPPGRFKRHSPSTAGRLRDRRRHDRPWSIGDNESLAVGQGDVQVTPLQLAVAYSALANGGTVVTPALRRSTSQSPDGTVLQNINPPPARHFTINPLYRADDPAGPPRRRLAVRRHLGRRDPGLPASGVRQDRHRAVHRPAGLRLVLLLRAVDRDQQADPGRGHGREGRLRRRRPPRRWRGRSCRSGSSARRASTWRGARRR